jgi:hypothetical protein
MIDEQTIQFALFKEMLARGHDIIVPNISWSYLNWEADLISVTRARYLYEFEIKISRQDFQQDFRKRKHKFLMHGVGRTPNYFSYVAPVEAIPLCIPRYAGLYEVRPVRNGFLRINQVKKPVRLHTRKIDPAGIHSVLRTLMFKYFQLSENLVKNKIQREIFKEHEA